MTVIQPANWKESTFYREAVDNVVLYNTQLSRERKARLPYHDAQTGIAQSDCYIWRTRLERRRGVLPCQIYSYPPRRWRVEGKPQQKPTTKGDTLQVGTAECSTASVGPVTTVTITTGVPVSVSSVHVPESGVVVAKKSSRIAGLNRKDEETSESSEGNEEESPDVDVDYMEDYDSEEERRQRKKKALVKSTKSTPSQQKTSKSNDKPFLCNICNRRYKTASTLKAHTTQNHGGADPIPSAVEKVPVILPPPPSLQGKPCAKPNPYCDFCLGEDSSNKKTGKPEKMVSCADCGRSAHPSCLQFTLPLAKVVLTYRWQCIECKSCHLCGTSDNDDQLLFCDDCDRGYHMYCLTPPIKEPPEGSWSCGLCLKPVLPAKVH